MKIGDLVLYTGEERKGPMGVIVKDKEDEKGYKVFFFRSGTSSWIEEEELEKYDESR